MSTDIANLRLAFIGGGNMASAIIGGLLRQGMGAERIQVVEPLAEQRERLLQMGALQVHADALALSPVDLTVWAVKPQTFAQAANQAGPRLPGSLHLSVAAGIRSDSIARWLGSERVVRAMPNTPALIGQGVTALYARAAVTAAERQVIDAVLAPTGQTLWLQEEAQLDAVTALSGSGPAYVFYFIEAMAEAGVAMGLPETQALHLAKATFTGAAALAQNSSEPPSVLRERVTSKGGTTYAALTAMERAGIKPQFMAALEAARARAKELGDEFGRQAS